MPRADLLATVTVLGVVVAAAVVLLRWILFTVCTTKHQQRNNSRSLASTLDIANSISTSNSTSSCHQSTTTRTTKRTTTTATRTKSDRLGQRPERRRRRLWWFTTIRSLAAWTVLLLPSPTATLAFSPPSRRNSHYKNHHKPQSQPQSQSRHNCMIAPCRRSFPRLFLLCNRRRSVSFSASSLTLTLDLLGKRTRRHQSHCSYIFTPIRKMSFLSSISSTTTSSATTTDNLNLNPNNNIALNVPLLSTLVAEMHDASLEHLQSRMAEFVQQQQQSSSSNSRVLVAMAGGGGHFLSTLAATPGASALLLEGRILYDRESYRRFVKRNLGNDFRYASNQASVWAADAALHEAQWLAAAADPNYGHDAARSMPLLVGVGSASVLRSDEGQNSRAFVTVATSDSHRVTLEAKWPADIRTRFQQDVFVAHCVLTCLEFSRQLQQQQCFTTNGNSTIDQHVTTEQGDEINIQATLPRATSTTDILQQAAQLILDGTQESVLLLPSNINDHSKDNGINDITFANSNDVAEFQMVTRTLLPPQSLIFPGSFHPPHTGHVQLAQAALQASDCHFVWFELSLTNADKPALQVDDVVERLAGFLRLQQHLPPQWGIVLTNAPLFVQKVQLLHLCQVSRKYDADTKELIRPPLHFVIGTDTLVRILNPKYYDNSEDTMLAALRDMPCQFVVGGRVQQQPQQAPASNNNNDAPSVFVSGQDQVDQLPAELQSKFTLLEDFRVDISSTEIRRRQEQEQQQKEEEEQEQ